MSNGTIETLASSTSRPDGDSRHAMSVRSIKLWIAWIRQQRRTRRSADQLHALDDHMLADIGLNRADIDYVARYGRLPRAPHVPTRQSHAKPRTRKEKQA